MVAYSFKRRFVDAQLAGTKDQTIRLDRRGWAAELRPGLGGHARPGKGIQNFTGMRTRDCALILRSVCTENLFVMLRGKPIVHKFHFTDDNVDVECSPGGAILLGNHEFDSLEALAEAIVKHDEAVARDREWETAGHQSPAAAAE